MDKLLDFVERKCGEVVRDALRNAIILFCVALSAATFIAEAIIAYLTIKMIFDGFVWGIAFLVLDFAAFGVTVFIICLIIVWCDYYG